MIPDHQLLRLIERGSYGEVWLARNAFGAFRAVKVIFEHTFRDKRPFERELGGVQKFEPVSRLHEGLMDILQVGRNEEGGYFYCVMELADDVVLGQAIEPEHYIPLTLAREVARCKRLPLETTLQLGIAIGAALDFLHGRGLIHRDVKPSNIVFINGVPKLADIGLVVEMSEAHSYVGTEGFIPPEGPGTVQSDIYSLGKVLYEISTGKDRNEYPELPTLLSEDSESARQLIELNKIILKACRSQPRNRYKSARQMIADLKALQQKQSINLESRDFLRRHAITASVLGCIAALIVLLAHKYQRGLVGKARRPELATLIPGLIAKWRGEDNGNDALHGAKTASLNRVDFVPGRNGRAFSFDGNKGFLEVPDAASLRVGEEVTIEFWVKRQQLTQADFIIEKGGDWTGEKLNYSVALNGEESNNSLMFGFACGCRLAGRIADLQWHHCAVSARNGDADPIVYIDGVLQPVFYRRGEPTIRLQPSSEPVHLGAQIDPEQGYNYFSPKVIGEVSLYNRVLSLQQVLLLASGSIDELPTQPEPGPFVDAESTAGHSDAVPIPAPAGLVGWWRGEADARDSAGTNHGVLIGNVAFVPAMVGQGFKLTGTGAYIRVLPSPSLDLAKELTIELWFQDLGKIRYNYGLVSKRGSETNSINYDIGVTSHGVTIIFNDPIVEGGEIPQSSFEGSNFPEWPKPYVWHHLGATYRQIQPDRVELNTFLDGKLVKSASLLGSLARSINSYPVTIGADAEYPTYNYFEGIIDEVSIYNRALSAVEIEGIFRAGSAGKTVKP